MGDKGLSVRQLRLLIPQCTNYQGLNTRDTRRPAESGIKALLNSFPINGDLRVFLTIRKIKVRNEGEDDKNTG